MWNNSLEAKQTKKGPDATQHQDPLDEHTNAKLLLELLGKADQSDLDHHPFLRSIL